MTKLWDRLPPIEVIEPYATTLAALAIIAVGLAPVAVLIRSMNARTSKSDAYVS